MYRVALTNRRLTRFVEGRVTFQDTHARTQTTRALTLPVETFLTRFLDHVLPRCFTKVRWYGLLSASRRRDLNRARALLGRSGLPPSPPEHTPPSAVPVAATSTSTAPSPGADPALPNRCPACSHGQRVLVQHYLSARAPPRCPTAA